MNGRSRRDARPDDQERNPVSGWFQTVLGRLYPFRPRVRDRRFWVVQVLILFIAGIHDLIETGGFLGHLGALYFVPESLFFVPVIYAALNFGFAGSLATSLWATLITIPNFAILHSGVELWGVMLQMTVVNAVAVFVGQRVDREVRARERAEAAEEAHRASEARYRGLFESSPVAVLVFDNAGIVQEANPAAAALLGRADASLSDVPLSDLIGREEADRVMALSASDLDEMPHFSIERNGGGKIYLEPAITSAGDLRGDPLTQVLLQDVTDQVLKQAGLKAYAAYVIRAQEEERKRIAHELHDEAVQMLILVCRRLDELEGSPHLQDPVRARLREPRELAEQVVRRLRDFTRNLRPPTLDDLGLVTSIRRIVSDLGESADTSAGLRLGGEERRLPPDAELGVFRIAQEALRNVERHARARHVRVTLSFAEDELRLDVLDDGVGFSQRQVEQAPSDGNHLGLVGMRERAEILGGTLTVQSEVGAGTHVVARIPTGAGPGVEGAAEGRAPGSAA